MTVYGTQISGDEMYELGRRVCSKGVLGTIRFCGTLPGNRHTWLGIEWDNADLGKHSGEYQGIKIFECSSGCGSFLRLDKAHLKFDKPQGLLTALHAKYGSSADKTTILAPSITRSIELVGFDQAAIHYRGYLETKLLAVPSACVAILELPEETCFPSLQFAELSDDRPHRA